MKNYIRHTYLFEQGKWKALGTYFNENGEPTDASGLVEIIHKKTGWFLEGFMELHMDNPVTFYNNYQINPFKKGMDFTQWESDNPVLGKMAGHFIVINDTIISKYQTFDQKYSGTEILLYIDKDQYQNWGFALEGDVKVSSWEVMLERIH